MCIDEIGESFEIAFTLYKLHFQHFFFQFQNLNAENTVLIIPSHDASSHLILIIKKTKKY